MDRNNNNNNGRSGNYFKCLAPRNEGNAHMHGL